MAVKNYRVLSWQFGERLYWIIGDWMLELCFGISGVYGNFWPSDADAHFGLECSEEQIRIFHKVFVTWNSVYDF